MYSLKALSLLLLVGAVAAQYNYQKPEAPKNTYLPPTTTKPILSQEQINAEGLNPDGEHEPGMPFDFTYAVKEDDGNDFSHQAQSDGDVVKGEYRILLPDGRTQVVKYTADWKNGYNAEVTFEGEAVYPEPAPTRPPAPRPPPTTRPPPPRPVPTTRPPPPPRPQPTTRPPPPPRPTQTTRNPYENQEDNDSQGLRPTPTTGYNYQPPTTRRPPPPPPTTRRPPPPPPTTRRAPPPPPPTTTRRPAPPTTRPPPPPPPVGLYGTPDQPFGVRNNPKFGYSK
ncbi:leucine-rich repeat extensin-like protein 3 [Folsomia candida]|uniref:Pro-resilin n=1 Tax=Folsomia candida TaxID=158441 RepID=A0A226EW27_FOLCA|nr:leucine-rich repeat extensin-like protein 3 [Folsomia candida]OXA61041.1 hypothetical protein Fcan01_05207 [Folsomia candida]